MLSWNEALASVLRRVTAGPVRKVRLVDAAGCVLGRPLVARNDSPPFDLSAVDGFGVHPADVRTASERSPVQLQLMGTIRAGGLMRSRLRRGTAVKILTGGCVPPGVGAVVMKEYCRQTPRGVLVSHGVAAGENIRRRGGEFRKGQRVLPAGVRVTPPVMGLLASFGYATVSVHETPVVTVAVTGDELLPPGEPLRPGKIHDANSYALAAAVRALGAGDCRTMRLKDQPAILKRGLARALLGSDVLLAVGGMSVGDYDYVRSVLDERGVKEVFWRVAVKPGKPAYFGIFRREEAASVKVSRGRRRRSCLVFGLPGNPVSALVCFHQLVKPALLKLMGLSDRQGIALRARLIGERRKKPDRLEWLRGVMSVRNGELLVRPTIGQDSHMLGGLARANCLICLPQAATCVPDGAEVVVEPLTWQE